MRAGVSCTCGAVLGQLGALVEPAAAPLPGRPAALPPASAPARLEPAVLRCSACPGVYCGACGVPLSGVAGGHDPAACALLPVHAVARAVERVRRVVLRGNFGGVSDGVASAFDSLTDVVSRCSGELHPVLATVFMGPGFGDGLLSAQLPGPAAGGAHDTTTAAAAGGGATSFCTARPADGIVGGSVVRDAYRQMHNLYCGDVSFGMQPVVVALTRLLEGLRAHSNKALASLVMHVLRWRLNPVGAAAAAAVSRVLFPPGVLVKTIVDGAEQLQLSEPPTERTLVRMVSDSTYDGTDPALGAALQAAARACVAAWLEAHVILLGHVGGALPADLDSAVAPVAGGGEGGAAGESGARGAGGGVGARSTAPWTREWQPWAAGARRAEAAPRAPAGATPDAMTARRRLQRRRAPAGPGSRGRSGRPAPGIARIGGLCVDDGSDAHGAAGRVWGRGGE